MNSYMNCICCYAIMSVIDNGIKTLLHCAVTIVMTNKGFFYCYSSHRYGNNFISAFIFEKAQVNHCPTGIVWTVGWSVTKGTSYILHYDTYEVSNKKDSHILFITRTVDCVNSFYELTSKLYIWM